MPKIQVHKGFYNRDKVDPNAMYIFTENLDRTSGNNLITKSGNPIIDSLYLGKFYPTVTQAVVRGLPNAYPITTKYKEQKGALFVASQYDLFVKSIDDDIKRIIDNQSNYDIIYFSEGGFATERSGLLYDFAITLKNKLFESFGLYTILTKNKYFENHYGLIIENYELF